MTLNKTEEEKMRGAFETWFSNAHPVPMGYNRKEDIREAWQAAIAHANSKHSAILEDYDRIGRVAEKQAQQIAMLRAGILSIASVWDENDFGYYRLKQDLFNLLPDTQAAADAYKLEIEVNLLNDLAALATGAGNLLLAQQLSELASIRASANRKDE